MATIIGTSSNDILFGTRNADYIDGGDRRDYISAGGGNDYIIGNLGNDILNGGKGYDTFFFGHLHDADTIEDFTKGDFIALGGGIDHYFITEESNGIRIATVDWQYEADLVQGSIVLYGVTGAQWRSWGGDYGNPYGYSTGMSDLIGFV